MIVAGIIQARMDSSRLSGKILLQACGKSFLEHLLERVSQSKKLHKIVVATTINENDNKIQHLCDNLGYECFRGSEDDVLSRYKTTADAINADVVVRLTGDNPCIDPLLIDKTVDKFLNSDYDYVSTCCPMPRTYPEGYTVEVFSSVTLDEVNREAIKPSDREHVTFFIWNQPERYKIHRLDYHKDLSKYRLTLDYPEDYFVIKSVFEGLYQKNLFFTMEEVIEWLDAHSEITKVNSHIKPNQGWLKSFDDDAKMGYL